ncbi:YheC/YheD family protein [Thalassobacillus devorans]|uniref:YheC/YheD family protein n=1 Tax=Thalassobacillus devorans TaxID=279813 RepID=UPI000A1C8C2D|nr:YheC/YheD family protein [Thalassobacillus devorans]
MSEKRAKKFYVSGKVQKVGYRKWVKEQALNLDIDGYVKNLKSGRVLVIAAGTDKDLEEFKNRLNEGPSKAEVEGIKEEAYPKSVKEGFIIKKTAKSQQSQKKGPVADNTDSNIQVGFLRNFIQPPFIAKMVAMVCDHYGMEVIYFRPRDVDMEKNIIKGKKLVDGEWVRVNTDIPPFIDISPFVFKFEEVTSYLRDRSILSDNGLNRVSKAKLESALKDDPNFSHLPIPTYMPQDMSELKDIIKEHSSIVMKPEYGRGGEGIYFLRKDGDKYHIGHNTEEEVLSESNFERFYEESIKGKGYVVQKYISSRTLQGDPFDCRVHVEKNGEGKWEIARNYIRIGIAQKVISNVRQGGGVADPVPFLKANFPDQWEEIDAKLTELAMTLPYKLEEIRQQELLTLGFDVGIDKKGDLYLFEANSAPAARKLKAESAYLRAGYYKHVLETKVLKGNLKKREVASTIRNLESKNESLRSDVKKLKSQVDKLKKEKEKYENANEYLENSFSWKVTKPLRAIRKGIKK